LYAKPEIKYCYLNQQLNKMPLNYRSGAANSRIRFILSECSLGAILIAATEIGVCAIDLNDDPNLLTRDLLERFPLAELISGDHEFEQWMTKIVNFIEAPSLNLNLPLDLRGTAFQLRVWHALQQIPTGKRITYTELAQRIGAPKAIRAVGSACAANRLAVVIPCHRVVRAEGSGSGYRWGMARKVELLRRERELSAGTQST
jgi:AraC family transcriptional regulator, regulatory protein of adaptative response / methylated-DNA-[protein]-cysteine methyltransferase